MKYISRTNVGYMVRKRVNGRLYQSFFGDSACGGEGAAKQAAIAYRDQFLGFLDDEALPSRRFKNVRNRTGVVGVAWYPPIKEEGEDSREHVIRARVTNDKSSQRLTTRSWALRRYGLWGAYFRAADWRHREVNRGRGIPEEEITAAFEIFLSHYMDMADLLDERLPALMHGLETVLNDASAPDAVKAMVEGKIKARRGQRRTNA
ncbi:hypothetical protein BBH56_03450 [Spiribacter roseus]|uniref:hypothetical protein n=1 Tax=Spiribacter roseus TaxID=1855875 RepID=UPI000F6BB940|nr:hypothetical protein BBH56_03450 [Spiribacter roseus]